LNVRKDNVSRVEVVKSSDVGLQKGPSSHYYVIFTMPHFFRDFMMSILAQVLIILAILYTPILKEAMEVGYDMVVGKVMSLAHQLALWSVISLLSSSCCAFQLILNMFSVGCAGLNSKMGPLRPFFMAFATISQLWQWVSIQKVVQYPQAVTSLVLTLLLTFLPEILYIYVHWKPFSTTAANCTKPTTKSYSKKYRIKISGMNCIACVQTIKRAIESTEGVKAVDVILEQAEAHVLLDHYSENGKIIKNQKIVENVCENIESVGFDADPKQAYQIKEL